MSNWTRNNRAHGPQLSSSVHHLPFPPVNNSTFMTRTRLPGILEQWAHRPPGTVPDVIKDADLNALEHLRHVDKTKLKAVNVLGPVQQPDLPAVDS